eukprot:3768808-Rhodomonas_salina.2
MRARRWGKQATATSASSLGETLRGSIPGRPTAPVVYSADTGVADLRGLPGAPPEGSWGQGSDLSR